MQRWGYIPFMQMTQSARSTKKKKETETTTPEHSAVVLEDVVDIATGAEVLFKA